MQHAAEAADHVPARPLPLHCIGDGILSSPSEWGRRAALPYTKAYAWALDTSMST